MEQTLAAETRERVDRWIEEGQYLIGRLLPEFLQEHDRLRARAEATERECDKLRDEVGALRKEISGVHTENQHLRAHRAELVDTCTKMISQINHMLDQVAQTLRIGG